MGDLTALIKSYKNTGINFLVGYQTMANGFKLKECRFRLDLKKRIFTMRVVKHRNRFLREVVNSPSLQTFKVRFHRALSNQV